MWELTFCPILKAISSINGGHYTFCSIHLEVSNGQIPKKPRVFLVLKMVEWLGWFEVPLRKSPSAKCPLRPSLHWAAPVMLPGHDGVKGTSKAYESIKFPITFWENECKKSMKYAVNPVNVCKCFPWPIHWWKHVFFPGSSSKRFFLPDLEDSVDVKIPL